MKYLFTILIIALFTSPIEARKKTGIDPQILLSSVQGSSSSFFEIYKTIHSNPELSQMEKETSALVAAHFRNLGMEVTENLGGYGVVGIFRNGDGPIIMLRADMDALPVKEETGLPFASEKTMEYNGTLRPVMHACGHDMHTTVLLGTVSTLVKYRSAWKGTLMAVAQPAEEVGLGSEGLIADGIFSRILCPDIALGYHVAPELPAGYIGYTKGAALAGNRDINITFYGKGTHGAFPHKGIDPIVMASAAVLEFQSIVSRNIQADQPAVVTVGSFNAGSRPNIIPDKVDLQLTTRYFDDEVGDLIEKRIREICSGIALSMGMDKMPLVESYSFLPPVYNSPELTETILTGMKTIMPAENLVESPVHMVSEDFAHYSGAIAEQKKLSSPAPTVLFWLGASKSFEDVSGPLHSPTFYPEFEETFCTGVSAMVAGFIYYCNL